MKKFSRTDWKSFPAAASLRLRGFPFKGNARSRAGPNISFTSLSPAVRQLKNVVFRGSFPIVFSFERLVFCNEALTHLGSNDLSHACDHYDYHSGEFVKGWLKINEDSTVSLIGDPCIEKIEGCSILLGGSENFGHNLWEWFSRFVYLVPELERRPEAKLLVFDKGGHYERLVRHIRLIPGFDARRIRLISQSKLYECEELILAECPFRRGPQSELILDPEAFFLTRYLFGHYPSVPNPGIFIMRGRAKVRSCVNEEAVAAYLEDLGISTFVGHDLPFSEQLNLVRGANFVISSIGAGSALAALAPTHSTIVELTPSNKVFGMYGGILSSALLQQSFIRVEGRRVTGEGRERPEPLFWDYEVSMEAIAQLGSAIIVAGGDRFRHGHPAV